MKKRIRLSWLLFAAVAVVGIVAACTADDDLWGLEDETGTSFDGKTRAESSDTMKYLSISTYNPQEWTDKDYEVMSEAEERIGVSFSEVKNKYVFDKSSAKGINMSDSLYDIVVSMFEHTNSIMNANQKKISRKKVKAGDISSALPDCVPAAISHMGKDAPSYQAAIAKCTELFPKWKTSGGVPENQIESFIEVYTPVTARTDMSFCKGNTSLENLVMVFLSGNYGHAVNAYQYTSSTGTISYSDYSATSTGNGSIKVGQLRTIYTFDE